VCGEGVPQRQEPAERQCPLPEKVWYFSVQMACFRGIFYAKLCCSLWQKQQKYTRNAWIAMESDRCWLGCDKGHCLLFITAYLYIGVARNWSWEGRTAARKAEIEAVGFMERGLDRSPTQPARGSGERCKLPSGVRGGARPQTLFGHEKALEMHSGYN